MKSLAMISMVFLTVSARAGGWSDNPKVQEWLQSAPVHACCAMSDGFLADEYESVAPGKMHTEGGVIAHITDNDVDPPCWTWRDEDMDTTGTTCRRNVPKKLNYFVPQSKIVYTPGNPTGHGVLFLNNSDGDPRCYFLPAGG